MNVHRYKSHAVKALYQARTHGFWCGVSQLLVLLAVALTLSSCDLLRSDDENPPLVSRVIVANGGNFSDQNGSITSFDPSSRIVDQLPAMSGFLQGIAAREGKLYALLNTFSVGRIDVLNTDSFGITAQINNVVAPRSIVFASESAYVTNFVFGSSGHVAVISLESGSVIRTIEVGSNPEGMIISGTMLYVANSGAGNTISIIDMGTNDVDTRSVACDAPRDLFGGDGDDIIVACTGKTVYNDDFSEIIEQTNGSVLFFGASLDVFKGRIDLDVQLGSTNGTGIGTYIDSTGELYLVDGTTNTIFRVDTITQRITREVQLDSESGLTGISGIAYDDQDERLYVGRFPISSAGPFPDFTTSGTVEIYDRNFEVSDSFLAGISISQILLLEEK